MPASPYAKNVKRVSSGDVYMRIKTEKQKGETCNPTSMSMILDYYGIYVSSARLRRDSEKNKKREDRKAYMFSSYLMEQLKKYKMQMLYIPMMKDAEKEVFESVKRAIDCGIPLQWLVDLLQAPDYDIKKKQKEYIIEENDGDGAHVRVFHGYHLNMKTKKIDSFIFSDSWGVKHRKKNIKIADVAKMTNGFYLIVPERINRKIINYIYEPIADKLKEKEIVL